MQWTEELNSACHAVCDFSETGSHRCVLVESDLIRVAVKRVYREGYFLEDVTCLDMEEGYVLLYHFDHFDKPGRVTLRVVLDHAMAELPTIADIFQGAEWHERECMDFYPVVFRGNPNMSRLLLPDDMEEKPMVKPDKKRMAMLDVFRFKDLVSCSESHPIAKALQEKHDAALAEAAKAAEEAEQAEAAQEAQEQQGEE